MEMKISKGQFVKRLISVLIIVLIFAAIFSFMDKLEDKVDYNQLALYETTIRQYLAQCYAIEGFYPEDISYLQEEYGLNLNTDKYVYHYYFIGSNMMPEIKVFFAETK